jgi:hypothetical protein
VFHEDNIMRRSIALIPFALAVFASPSPARAGLLFTGLSGYGEEQVTYEAKRDGPSVIVVRTLADGRLMLTDSRSKITLANPRGPLGCRLRGRHVAVCREPISFPIANVTVHAGSHGDVIDARSLSAYSISLEGGAGNDTLLAPQHSPSSWSRTTVTGGGGHNVVVGNSHTSISYAEAGGPVTVDLAKRLGVARGEHDHIVGVANVEGSNQAHNTLIGSRSRGTILGGSRGNLIVTLSPDTSVDFQQAVGTRRALPSTIDCLKASTVWRPESITNLTLNGHCNIGKMTLQLPLKSPSSAVLALDTRGIGDSEERHVELLAGPEHTVVGELNYRGTVAHQTVPCRLNAVGQELLRRKRRLSVIVKELYGWPEYPGHHNLWEIFTTVITVAHRR